MSKKTLHCGPIVLTNHSKWYFTVAFSKNGLDGTPNGTLVNLYTGSFLVTSSTQMNRRILRSFSSPKICYLQFRNKRDLESNEEIKNKLEPLYRYLFNDGADNCADVSLTTRNLVVALSLRTTPW